MRTLKTTLLIIIIGLSLNGFAQLESFDLSKYKLPDLKRRSLNTYFNLSGYNTYYKIPGNQFISSSENAYNTLSSNLNFTHYYYLNNRKYQRNSTLILNLNSHFDNRKVNKDLVFKNYQLQPQLNYLLENRKYFKPKTFYETDLDILYRYTRKVNYSLSRFTNQTEKTGDINSHSLSVAVPLKIGKGRIENVQDARHAVYIFEELKKVGRINSNMSDDEILEFAALISEIKNRRYFDARLRKIAEINSIDSFFVSKGYINKQDADYFTTLNDYWLYGDQQTRLSGTRVSFAAIPRYSIYSYNNNADIVNNLEVNYNTYSLSITGGFELRHEKPISQKWQNSIALNLYGDYISAKKNDETYSQNYKYKMPSAQLGFSQTIGFYPNTRTDAGFLYSLQYAKAFDKTDANNDIIGFEGMAAQASTKLWVNYYISPKFRLFLDLSFLYIWQESDDKFYIDFDKYPGNNYVLSSLNNEIENNSYSYKSNELLFDFRMGLSYSIF